MRIYSVRFSSIKKNGQELSTYERQQHNRRRDAAVDAAICG